MNYYKMICEKELEKLAVVEDGIPYTYGELIQIIDEVSANLSLNEDKMYDSVNNGTWKKIGEDEKNGKKVYTIKSRMKSAWLL